MKIFFSVFLFCAFVGFSVQDYKVVCYYTSWSSYRSNDGAYYPSHIDPKLCTHINYAFAYLDDTDLIMRPSDSYADITRNLYADVAAYKQQGIKVLISIGGWVNSAGDTWSRLVNDPAARANFNQNAIEFLQEYGFDGIDIFWLYPKCWQSNCNAGPNSDRTNFARWIEELRTLFNSQELQSYGYLLSAAVSPSTYIVPKAYDVPTLSANLDYINLMTYDFHGTWETKTGHVSPLFANSFDTSTLNTNYSVNYWISLGADPKKIVMGIPLYGNSYTLKDASNNGLNAPVTGGGAPGVITGSSGSLAFSEICYHITVDGWTVVRDPTGSIGPYAYKGDQWVAYDDIESVKAKSNYIVQKGLGGAMVWSLDLDDFWNRCNCEDYPLLRTIYRVLIYPVAPKNCPLLGSIYKLG